MWNYQVGLPFGGNCRGIRQDYQVRLPFRSKAEVSEGTIRWDYLLEVKQRYKVELSAGIDI